MNKKYISSFGFTLVELLVVIAIMSILMSIAGPNLKSLINSTRLTTVANAMVSALQRGRSESVKQVQSVSIVPKTGSLGTANWKNGWTVFVDINQNGVQATDGTEPTLGSFDAISAGFTVNTTSYTNRATYRSDGRITQSGSFYICAPNDFRRIVIASTGRVKVETPANESSTGSSPITYATACP